jgi:hypothetical protein
MAVLVAVEVKCSSCVVQTLSNELITLTLVRSRGRCDVPTPRGP